MTSNERHHLMCAAMNGQRLVATAAVVATAMGGLTTFAGPAGAAAGPTATLGNGIVTITGTAAGDVVDVEMSHDVLTVDFGFDGTVDAHFPMSRIERVIAQLNGGDDGLSVTGIGVGDVPITISGGSGNDALGVVGFEDALVAGDAPVTIFGDGGNDTLSASVPGSASISLAAGAGNDVVFGGHGSIGPERISLGAGIDKLVSTFDVAASPFRTRSDTVDGGAGRDTLELRGTFKSENLDLSANAGHLLVAHDQGDIDAVGFENVTWFGFGGNDEGGSGDSVTVNDLSGTGVVNFTPNFSSPFDATVPNNSSDQLRVAGTAGADHITVSGSGANITVTGLVPTVTPVLLNSADMLRIETLGGNDTVNSSGLQRGLVQLQVF
jgi:hypothetical protein